MSLTRWILVSIVHLLILNDSWIACQECNNGDYAPNPFDCNGFLQCQFGRWIQRNCPRELHFNRVNFVCDFAWNANCYIAETTSTITPDPAEPTTTTSPSSTTTSTTTSSPTTSTTTASPTTTTHLPTDLPTGPPTTPTTTNSPTTSTTTTTHLPTDLPTGPPTTPTTTNSPTTSTTTTTPLPTDFPTGSPPTTPTTTVSPTTITSFPTNPPTPTNPPILECTPTDGPYVLHLPHPKCYMFYKCVHGIPHEMLCPISQHWAIDLDRCDSPSEANCIDGAAREQLNARPPNYW